MHALTRLPCSIPPRQPLAEHSFDSVEAHYQPDDQLSSTRPKLSATAASHIELRSLRRRRYQLDNYADNHWSNLPR
jgi:hypothetical protein